jgi:hypothetical protein
MKSVFIGKEYTFFILEESDPTYATAVIPSELFTEYEELRKKMLAIQDQLYYYYHYTNKGE